MNYTLDANGNLTSDGVRTFEFDEANRLSQVKARRNGDLESVQFLHDARGQRVFKSEPQSQDYEPKEEELGSSYFSWLKLNFSGLFGHDKKESMLGTAYVYGDGQLPDWALLGEYGNGSARSKGRSEYLWLPTEDQGAIPVGLYRNEQFFAVHTDHLGTPRLITDDENKPVWQWAYSGFGNNKPVGVVQGQANADNAASKPALEFDLRFPGQIADRETGLFYNFFRNYQPSQGRYTQSDPIGLEGGLNPYQYAGSNPLKYTDPLGLYTEVVVWQGVGVGSSSFGHVSTNVNGQNFSWGPGGWDKQSATATAYNRRQQDFRGGTGVMLNLSPQQEAALASCMRASTAAYSAVTNNCGNPVQQCLNAVGAGVGNSVLPSSILENLRSSPNSNGNVSYPSPGPSSGFGGGLLWR